MKESERKNLEENIISPFNQKRINATYSENIISPHNLRKFRSFMEAVRFELSEEGFEDQDINDFLISEVNYFNDK